MSKQIVLIHEAHAYNKDIILMTLPLFLLATFYFGPRVLFLMFIAWLTARLCDRFAAVLRSRQYNGSDNSSVAIAFIITLMLPATVPIRVVVVSIIMAVLVVKEAFGGYGHYPFNPAAVGFCVAAVSWPEEVLRYPPVQNWVQNPPQDWASFMSLWRFENVTLVEGPSYILRTGALPNIDTWNLILGNYAGPMGITASLVILSCGVYLFVKKRLPLTAPLCYVGITAFIAFFFPRYEEIFWNSFGLQDILNRLQVVKFELLTGVLIFAAVFMVDEQVTLPKTRLSQAVYGLLLGFASMMFRYFGTYELGTCFAFILINSVSGFFDRAIEKRSKKTEEVRAQ